MGIFKRPFFSHRKGENFIKNDFPSSYLHKYQGIAIARFSVHYHISANFLSLISIPIGLLGAYCFAVNQLILGALLFWIRMMLDSADGKTARLSGNITKLGKKLDYIGDTVCPIAMYFGLWWSQYYVQGEAVIGSIVIGCHYLVIFVGFILLQNYSYKTFFSDISSYYSPFEEAYITFFFAPLLGIVKIAVPLAIVLQMVSYSILIVKRGEVQDVKKSIKNMLFHVR